MSSKHNRRRSPSPDSSDGDYSDRPRRSGHRSHKSEGSSGRSHRSDKTKYPPNSGASRGQFDNYDIPSATHPASAVPPNMRRPQPTRSMSDDTIRPPHRDRDRSDRRDRDRGDKYGSDRSDRSDRGSDRDRRDRDRDRDRDRNRGFGDPRERTRDRGRKYSYSDDDDSYYYDRHGRPHRGDRDAKEVNRHGRRREYESDNEYERSRSRDRNRGGGQGSGGTSGLSSMKPIVEDVLAAFGVVNAKHSRDHGDGHRGGSTSYDRDVRDTYDNRAHGGGNGGGGGMNPKQSKALKAAIMAAAMEAFRQRKQPGGFTPERILKIASAAIAAGGLDAIVAARPGQGSTRQMIEGVIGKGANLLGGSSGRSGSGRRDGDSRSGGSGLSGLIRSLTVSDKDRR